MGNMTLSGIHILVVDDAIINQQITKEILEDFGASVSLASNGEDALNQINTVHFDLILMDVQMPKLDGYETTQIIRNDLKNGAIPIIAMTGGVTQQDQNDCIEAGMNDYLTKPIDPDELFFKIGKYLSPPQESSGAPPTETIISVADADENIPANLPGIEIEAGIKRVRGNKDIYFKLLFNFCEEYQNFETKIDVLSKQKENNAAIEWLHCLKGLAGNISIPLVYNEAQNLERLLKTNPENNLEHFKAELNRLINTMNQVFESKSVLAVQIAQESMSSTDQSDLHHSLDYIKIKEELNKFIGYLKQNELEAETCFQKLKSQLNHPNFVRFDGFDEELKALEDDVFNFDFKAALEKITKIAAKIPFD